MYLVTSQKIDEKSDFLQQIECVQFCRLNDLKLQLKVYRFFSQPKNLCVECIKIYLALVFNVIIRKQEITWCDTPVA